MSDSERKYFEIHGPCCIVCDRCHRALGEDGKPKDFEQPGIATFKSQGSLYAADVADAAARQAGWKLSLRCPEEGDYGYYIECSECAR